MMILPPSCLRALACTVLMSSSAFAQGTWLLNREPGGGGGNSWSFEPAVSENGRFVAFVSSSTDLVPGDGNQVDDVFVRDRRLRTTHRVSVDSAGLEASNHSGRPSISADGMVVAFDSRASDLVAGDANAARDVFVHDRSTGQTTRVSLSTGGVAGNADSLQPRLSADGRYVCFRSEATNLVAADGNGSIDVFVHDRQTGQTIRVSRSSLGVEANDHCYDHAISADGAYVSFASPATNLVAVDANGSWDVFVHERATGQTLRRSLNGAGLGPNASSFATSLSGDGRYLAYTSRASDIVPGDNNAVSDVFVHDAQTGATALHSRGLGGGAANGPSSGGMLSRDGSVLAFESRASDLVPSDLNDEQDIFRKDLGSGAVRLVSRSTEGDQGDDASSLPAISGDGRFVAFESHATNLDPASTGNFVEAYVHGGFLSLEATPIEVKTGDTLTMTTWGAQPGGLGLFTLVHVNGVRFFVKLVWGSFDGDGQWQLAGTVPSTAAGTDLDFQTIGMAPDGKAHLSNLELVLFR